MSGERVRTAAQIRSAAYHEAGHAVASWRLGDGIQRVTIEPSSCPETNDRYGGTFTAARADPSARGGWGYRHAVMLMAGPAAQRALDPRSQVPSGAVFDMEAAANLAAVMCRSFAAERAFLAWAKAEARALIAGDWHLVEVLALALVASTSLDGAATTELLVATDKAWQQRLSEVRRSLPPIGSDVMQESTHAERRRSRPVTRGHVARSVLRVLEASAATGRESVPVADLRAWIARDLDRHGLDEAAADDMLRSLLGSRSGSPANI